MVLAYLGIAPTLNAKIRFVVFAPMAAMIAIANNIPGTYKHIVVIAL